MNNLTGIFITSFLIAFSGAVMPGPVLTITITEVTQRGFWSGPLIVLGHGLLELFIFWAVILGLGRFLTFPLIKGIIGFGGGIILIWFGSSMSFTSYKNQFSLDDSSRKKSLNPVLAGFFISLINPYWSIWWATIGLSYIVLSLPFGIRGLSAFYCGHILADLSWYTFISALISLGKKNFSFKIYHLIIFLCGIFLFLFGIYFLYFGWQNIAIFIS